MLTNFLLFLSSVTAQSVLALLITYILGAVILGKIWCRLTQRHRGKEDPAPPTQVALRDLLNVEFRNRSWYGRLYWCAYYSDREWLVRWVPKTFLRDIIWTQGTWQTPKEQPFDPAGPPPSLCRIFHRIMLSAWFYVPFVAKRYLMESRVGKMYYGLLDALDAITPKQVRLGRVLAAVAPLLLIWGATAGVNAVRLDQQSRELDHAAWMIAKDMSQARRNHEIQSVVDQELPGMLRNVREITADFEAVRAERCGSSPEELASRQGTIEDFIACANLHPVRTAIGMFTWAQTPDLNGVEALLGYDWDSYAALPPFRWEAERYALRDRHGEWEKEETRSWGTRHGVNGAFKDAFVDDQLAEIEISTQYSEHAELMAMASGRMQNMTQASAWVLGGSIPGLLESLNRWHTLEALRQDPAVLYTFMTEHGCHWYGPVNAWRKNEWSEKWSMAGWERYDHHEEIEPSCAVMGSFFKDAYLVGRQINRENKATLNPDVLAQTKDFAGQLGKQGIVAAVCVYALCFLFYLRIQRRKEEFLALSIIRGIVETEKTMVTDMCCEISAGTDDLRMQRSMRGALSTLMGMLLVGVLMSMILVVLTVASVFVILSAPVWAPPAVLMQQGVRSLLRLITQSDTLRLLVPYAYALKKRMCPLVTKWT